MIKIDENLLLNDLVSTAIELSLRANKDFVKKNYGHFLMLNESLYKNYDKLIVCDSIVNIDYYNYLLYKQSFKTLYNFTEYLYTNSDYFIELSDNFDKYLRSIQFSTYPFYDKLRKYSEKDFKDIILGFYSTYGDDYYKIAKKYFDEQRIHTGEKNDSDYSGCFSQLQWLKSGYIFSVFNVMNSLSAKVLVHELGHAIDAERFIFPQQKNIPTFCDYLVEVPSTTFELSFQDYLVNNRIDIDGGMVLRNCRIYDLKEDLDMLGLVAVNDDLYICDDGDAEDEYGEKYDVRDSMLYGLGYYYALHLNYIRNNSNKEFLKVFNNLITGRKEMTFEQSVECMGFSFDSFMSGKYIKPKIKDDLMELKKRYKY